MGVYAKLNLNFMELPDVYARAIRRSKTPFLALFPFSFSCVTWLIIAFSFLSQLYSAFTKGLKSAMISWKGYIDRAAKKPY